MFDLTIRICERLGIDPPRDLAEPYLPKFMEIADEILNRLDQMEQKLKDMEKS